MRPFAQAASPGRLSGHVWLIVMLVGIGLMGALTLVMTPPVMMTPDSGGYLAWNPIRTPGYPFFLWSVRFLDSEFAYLPYLQMALLVGAAAFLAQAAARLGGPWWIWVLMGAGILANPFLWRFAWQAQPESVFIALVMVFLGCISLALRRRPAGLYWLFAASLVLGAAILVRPVGYALLGVAPLVGLLWYGRRPSAVALATLPAIAVLLAVSSWNLVNKGYFATQVFGGYNILGQISLLVRRDVETGEPVTQMASRRIAEELSHVRERLPRDAADWQLYYWMTYFAYNPALYQHALPALSDADKAVGSAPADPVAATRRTNALAWSVSLATIRHDPAGYLYHVLTHFVGLWTLPAAGSAASAESLRKDLCAPVFKEFYCGTDQMDAIRVSIPGFAVPFKDGLFLGLMLLSFLLVIVVALRPAASPLLIFAAVAALSINANHLLVALVEAGLPRYAMAVWPAFMAMCAAFAAWLWVSVDEAWRRREGRDDGSI